MKVCVGVAVWLHSFLILVLGGDEWSGIHPTAGLNILEKRKKSLATTDNCIAILESSIL
jgi:hypothetical protein